MNRSVTLTHFHIRGTEQVERDRLNKSARECIKTCAGDLTNSASRPSGEIDILYIDMIYLGFQCFWETAQNLNQNLKG